jgi:hypothetical protein
LIQIETTQTSQLLFVTINQSLKIKLKNYFRQKKGA